MKCEHINKTLEKINNLIKRMNDTNSSLYERQGPYLKEEDIKTHLDDMGSYYKARTTWSYSYTFNSIKKNSLYDNLSDLFDELNSCNCHSQSTDKYDELEEKYNDLLNDLEEKKEELRKERENHNSEKLRHSETVSGIRIENTKLKERLEGSSSQTIELRKRLQDSESQVLRLEMKSDEKNVRIQNLNSQLADLRVESNNKENELKTKIKEKDNELKQKEEEIKNSQNQAGKSHEELLTEKLRSEKGNLELFVIELKISLEQINSLSRYHERLFQARKIHNPANIVTHEDNIARVKQELLDGGVSMVNIQEIHRKCEKIAELRWELEQATQKQYEARQEVPTNH
jgi:chromosome segregation ATPase